MRRLVAVLLFFGLCATAQAESFTVRATDGNTFTPEELAVKPGDSVTFSNGGGFHNVVWTEGTFDDGSQASPPDPAFTWPSDPVRTFQEEGTFAYYCEQHGTPGGAGMAGKVLVSSTAPPPDTTAPAVTDLRAGVKRKRPFATFTLDEPAQVVAVLRHEGETVKRVARQVAAGDRRVSFGRVAKGRYAIRVQAKDAAGNASEPLRVGLRVR
jgi:plastocyanin